MIMTFVIHKKITEFVDKTNNQLTMKIIPIPDQHDH